MVKFIMCTDRYNRLPWIDTFNHGRTTAGSASVVSHFQEIRFEKCAVDLPDPEFCIPFGVTFKQYGGCAIHNFQNDGFIIEIRRRPISLRNEFKRRMQYVTPPPGTFADEHPCMNNSSIQMKRIDKVIIF